MTSDKKPFFASTYFPKRQKWGRPGIMEVLTKLNTFWVTQQDDIILTSNKITDAVQSHFASHSKGALTDETLVKGAEQFYIRWIRRYT
jgi:uncharacterized protein YyaL (SSP411 family)